MKAQETIIDIIPYEDSRGALKKILMQSQLESGNIQEVYLLYTNTGRTRGNHYHKETLEFFTVVSGQATVALKDLGTGMECKFKVSEKDNKVIKVPPGVAHAFRNEAELPLVILAVSTKEYSSTDPDVFSLTIME